MLCIQGTCFGPFPARFNKDNPSKESACLQTRCMFEWRGHTCRARHSSLGALSGCIKATRARSRHVSLYKSWHNFVWSRKAQCHLATLPYKPQSCQQSTNFFCTSRMLNLISPHSHANRTVNISTNVPRLVGTALRHFATWRNKLYSSNQTKHFELSVLDSEDRHACMIAYSFIGEHTTKIWGVFPFRIILQTSHPVGTHPFIWLDLVILGSVAPGVKSIRPLTSAHQVLI